MFTHNSDYMVFTEKRFGEDSEVVSVRVPKSDHAYYKKEIEKLVQEIFNERKNKK